MRLFVYCLPLLSRVRRPEPAQVAAADTVASPPQLAHRRRRGIVGACTCSVYPRPRPHLCSSNNNSGADAFKMDDLRAIVVVRIGFGGRSERYRLCRRLRNESRNKIPADFVIGRAERSDVSSASESPLSILSIGFRLKWVQAERNSAGRHRIKPNGSDGARRRQSEQLVGPTERDWLCCCPRDRTKRFVVAD